VPPWIYTIIDLDDGIFQGRNYIPIVRKDRMHYENLAHRAIWDTVDTHGAKYGGCGKHHQKKKHKKQSDPSALAVQGIN